VIADTIFIGLPKPNGPKKGKTWSFKIPRPKRGPRNCSSGWILQSDHNCLNINPRYRHGGWHALDAKKPGGRRPKLDGKAMRWIYDTVTQKNPLQLRFPFAFWTCGMVGEVIYRRFKIRLSRASVGRLMTQLGLSAERHLWRTYQQDPEVIERWLKQAYPKIQEEARKRRAKIFFGDEAGIRSDFHSRMTWGIRSKTPLVSTTGARVSLNTISAVNRLGQLQFMVTSTWIGAKVFIEFLKRLIHAPELDPDEQVWNDHRSKMPTGFHRRKLPPLDGKTPEHQRTPLDPTCLLTSSPSLLD